MILFVASYIIGMVLSVLGTVMLIIGSLASFSSASPMSSLPGLFSKCFGSSPSTLPVCPFSPPPTLVLYALGTVISLIGTGFLIGVRLNFFYFLFFRRENNMSS